MGFDDPPPYTPTVGAPLQREISLTDAIDGQASSARTTRAQRESFLRTTELPAGMQEAMLASVEEFPLRIWIIDNSGSMQSGDGHVLEQKAGTEALVGCTRWQELGDALRWHARMAAYMSAPTEFRFLNPPSGGLQTMHCGTTADPESEIRALESVLACGPRGLTPLCAQIRQVCVWSYRCFAALASAYSRWRFAGRAARARGGAAAAGQGPAMHRRHSVRWRG